MRNEMCLPGELPTMEFVMREMTQNNATTATPENRRLSRLFNLLGGLQVLIVLGGALVGLFVAPASLFVSRTDGEAFFWLAVGFVGLSQIALGALTLPLALTAAHGVRHNRRYGKICGASASALAILAVPFGTIIGTYLLWKMFVRRDA